MQNNKSNIIQGPRGKDADEDRIDKNENGPRNDDNEESEGIAYEDDEEDNSQAESDDDSDKELDGDSEMHKQNPKENSY